MQKDELKKRLEEMIWLPPNWDGFGTGAISTKVHSVAYKLIEWIDEAVHKLRLYVGVDPEGSVWGELWFKDRKWEFHILPSGTIDYEEFISDDFICSGSFVPDKRIFLDLMNGQ